MKVPFTILLIAAWISGKCQQTAGVGPFTIGVTTTAIIDSLKDNGYDYSESEDWFYMLQQKKNRSIILLIPDHMGFIRYSKSKPTEKLKVYNIGSIGDANASNFILSFYNDTLYSIISNDFERSLSESIKINSDTPKLTVYKNTFKCPKFRNTSIMDTARVYVDQPCLRVSELRHRFYDRLCEKRETELFEIVNPFILDQLAKTSGGYDITFPYTYFKNMIQAP